MNKQNQEQHAVQRVYNYLYECNRPYSVSDITNNLQVEFSKSLVQKALDELKQQDKIYEKTYGKQKVYAINQSMYPEADKDTLNALQTDLAKVKQEIETVIVENKKLDDKLTFLNKLLSLEEVNKQLSDLAAGINSIENETKTFSTSRVMVSPKDKEKIVTERNKLVKEFKRRRKICLEIVDTILESYPKSKADFVEETGLDLMSESKVNRLITEGNRYYNDGRFLKAIDCYEKGLAFTSTLDPKRVTLHNKLAQCFCHMKLLSQALVHYKLVLQCARFRKDTKAEFEAHGNLANLYRNNMHHEFILPHYVSQLRLCNEEDHVVKSSIHYNIGCVYLAMAKSQIQSYRQNLKSACHSLNTKARDCVEQAIEHFRNALASAEKLKDLSSAGRAYGCLGNCFYLLNDFICAIFYHGKRLELAVRVHDKGGERRAYINLGNAYVFLNKFDLACVCFKSALAIAEKDLSQADEARICYSLGVTLSLKEQYAEALDYFLRYLNLCFQTPDNTALIKAYSNLIQCHQALGHEREVLLYTAERDKLKIANDKKAGELEMATNTLNLSADSLELSFQESLLLKHDSASSKIGSLTEMIETNEMHANDGDEEELYGLIESMQSRRINDQRTNPPPGIRL